MGCCTQHDILFESLTVEQHITLFFKLKIGFEDDGSKTITQRVDELIKVVSLQKHRHVESQHLSGGLRRRLSIALALASPNESSIVILDEPTTGLDAIVRDQVWQLIKSLKQNRCIIMTT
jgi:ATP-binding cassette, subfamily A (ABC1), member 3